MASNLVKCSLCFGSLGSSKGTKLAEVAELLEELFQRTNLKLFEEPLICDNCLIKVQSACKFKASYIENSQKICIKPEDVSNVVLCAICKESFNSDDCFPLFSVTEIDTPNSFKFLSSELEPKMLDNPQTCNLCHKSILNFCTVINLFSVAAKEIFKEAVSDLISIKSKNSGLDINVNGVDCTMDIKEEAEIKEEISGIKEDNADAEVPEEQEPATSYEDFLCKNEELDLKTEDEPTWSCDQQEEIFKCQLCDYQTGRKKYLKRHVLKHKPSEKIEMFKCQICDFQTKHKYYLNSHILVHKNSNETEMFKCHICDFQTKYKNNFKRHDIVHKNSNAVEMFKCHFCGYQTKYRSTLNKHILVHKNSYEIEMFRCEICGYETKFKGTLKTHLIVHNPNFWKKYKTISETHANHNSEIFKCQICDYQTKFKKYFNRHIIIHKDFSETEKFICYTCNFQTKSKCHLKRHLIVHRNSNEVEMFKCQICDYQTKYKRSLQSHLITHKKSNETEMFKCHICDFQTKRKYSLKPHLIRHNNIVQM